MQNEPPRSKHLDRDALQQSERINLVQLQLEQAYETFRTQITLMVSVLTILIIANVTVIGYGISQEKAGIILIGTIFPMAVAYAIYRVNKMMIPVLYTAVRLEALFGEDEDDWLATTFLGSTASTAVMKALQEIKPGSTQETRLSELKQVKITVFGKGGGFTRIMLVIATVGQLIAPIVLTLFFGWEMF